MARGKGGNSGGPWGRGPNVPPPPSNDDLDDLIRKSQEKFRNLMPEQNSSRFYGMIALVFVALWLASGIYIVEPEEQGVVLRFGEYHRTEEPGLRYHLPYPVEQAFTPQVTRVQRIEIGYRSFEGKEQTLPQEATMLTGDNNIIVVTFNVQWKIREANNFLFNIRNPEETVKDVAESVMREVISNGTLDAAITINKEAIQDDSRDLMQKLLDDYGAGIKIDRVNLQLARAPEDVLDAFLDVQAADQDRDTTINRAKAYANEILPRARGESERLIQEAEAYRAEVVNVAEGNAARFVSVYNAYTQAQDVTKKRLYLETLEFVMRDMNKVIISKQAGSGVVPYMALPEIEKRSTQGSK